MNRRIVSVLAAGALVLSLAACTEEPKTDAQSTGQRQTETAFAQQQGAVPYPAEQLKDSLERRNIKERLLRYNNPNKIGYIYLLTDTGGIYTYFTIKGKVSSTDSQMTTNTLLVDPCNRTGEDCPQPVDAPGDDGSYGPNEPGIFFFTGDGVMVTWNGRYLLTDAPLKIEDKGLVLTYVDGSKPTK